MKRLIRIYLCCCLCMLPLASIAEPDAAWLLAGLSMNEQLHLSQNQIAPFEPIAFTVKQFRTLDAAALRALPLALADHEIAAITPNGNHQTVSLKAADGTIYRILFYDYNGEIAFVFRETDTSTHLLDVLRDCAFYSASLIRSDASHHLWVVTEVWGHGTGFGASWERWYNVNTRRIELVLTRQAANNEYRYTAYRMTTDSSHEGVFGQTLTTYAYDCVAEDDWESPNPRTQIIHEQGVTVCLYEATERGLMLLEEKRFGVISPAMLAGFGFAQWGLAAQEIVVLDTGE